MPAVIGPHGIADFTRHHAEYRLGELGHHFLGSEDSEGASRVPGRFVRGIGTCEFGELFAVSRALGETGRESAGCLLVGLRLRLQQDVTGFRLFPHLVLEQVAVVVALNFALANRDFLGKGLLGEGEVANPALLGNLERLGGGVITLARLRLGDLHLAAPAVHREEPDVERSVLIAAAVFLPQFHVGHVRRLGDQRPELFGHQIGPDGILEVPRIQPSGAEHGEVGVPADEGSVLLKGGRAGDAGSDLGVRDLDSQPPRFTDEHLAPHQFTYHLLRNSELTRQCGREVAAALFLVRARDVPVAIQKG